MKEDQVMIKDTLVVNTLELEKVRLSLQESFNKRMLMLMDAKFSFEQYVNNCITARLDFFLYGEKVAKKTVRYPRDWWQAFKFRWFPKWLLSRWPVIYTVKVLIVSAVYPHFCPSLSREPYCIVKTFGSVNTSDIENYK